MCLVRKEDITPKILNRLIEMSVFIRLTILSILSRSNLLNKGTFALLTSICMLLRLVL